MSAPRLTTVIATMLAIAVVCAPYPSAAQAPPAPATAPPAPPAQLTPAPPAEATQPPATTPPAPLPHQVMIEDFSMREYQSEVNIGPPVEFVRDVHHVYPPIQLHHMSGEMFLNELYSAIVPGAGPVVCQVGQQPCNLFTIGGLDAVFPSHQNGIDGILVDGTEGTYDFFKLLIDVLDDPNKIVTNGSAFKGVKTTALEPRHASPNSPWTPWYIWVISLSHTTPDAVLTELNDAYIPSNGVITVGPGERVANAAGSLFDSEQVELVIPERRTKSLVVIASKTGFERIYQLLEGLGACPSN